MGFEPTIPVFERAKIFRALDRAAAVIGFFLLSWRIIWKMISQSAEIKYKVSIFLYLGENSYGFNVSKMTDVGYF
jgi:hypothetical protein